MRLKVWGIICSMPRLLEVSWDIVANLPSKMKGGEHYYHRLARKSCLTPALMHANREAREEAKRFYQQAIFTTRPFGSNAHPDYPCSEAFPTWYNPLVDVILFADNTCMNTIVQFLNHARHRQTPINQVAILLSGKVLSNCHSWNEDDPIHGPDEITIDYGYAIGGGCTVMQALHGIHKSMARTTMSSGIQGLKEVFFIVPTYLTPITPGTVDDSIWFRPASGNGTTSGQVNLRHRMEREVQLVRNGNSLPQCGNLDNWTQNDRIVKELVEKHLSPKKSINTTTPILKTTTHQPSTSSASLPPPTLAIYMTP
jgi:hypothetical protein